MSERSQMRGHAAAGSGRRDEERRRMRTERKRVAPRGGRPEGRFYGAFTPPLAWDAEQVRAALQDGGWTLAAPGREASWPRQAEMS